jgi:predicted RNase H-like HicB family nuclease
MVEIADRYTYRVFWSEEDGEYVGVCSEFEYLSHLDETPEQAFAGIRELVASAVQLLREESQPAPAPLDMPASPGPGATGH